MDLPSFLPVDPPAVLTIEDYVPLEPRDAYREGVDYLGLLLLGVSYPEWFSIHLMGPLLGVQWVEGGQVLGGVAFDSVQLRLEGEIDRL